MKTVPTQSVSTPLRRLFLNATLALSMGFVPFAVAAASADTAGAFYKTKLGNLEIIALSDGTNQLPVTFFSDKSNSESKDTYATAVNAYLVKRGDQLILIDSGSGDKAADKPSPIGQGLEAAGFKPEDVNIVLLTHFHGDHIGGLLKGDAIRFPNAKVYVPKEEAAHWLSLEKTQAAPEAARGSFALAQKVIAPYKSSGQYQEFEAGGTVVEGVKSVFAPGHTPGHTAFLVESGAEQKFLMWGDIVHNLPLQFAEPSITIRFDSDKDQAIKTRLAMLEHTSAEPLVVAGTHIAFPGIGKVSKKAEGGFEWTPVE